MTEKSLEKIEIITDLTKISKIWISKWKYQVLQNYNYSRLLDFIHFAIFIYLIEQLAQ